MEIAVDLSVQDELMDMLDPLEMSHHISRMIYHSVRCHLHTYKSFYRIQLHEFFYNLTMKSL